VQPLLKHSAGIKRLANGLGMAPERGIALQLEVGGQGPHTVHLVAHLAGRRLSRSAQPLIQRVHPVQQRRQLGVQRRARRSQLSLAFNGHGAGGQQLRQRGGAFAKDPLQRQTVLPQQLADGRFDQRG